MVLTRSQLSTFTNGSPLRVLHSTATLLHTAASSATSYIYLSAYNAGSLSRTVILDVAGDAMTAALPVTLRGGTKATQLVIPGMPIYASGSGVTITCRATSPSWTMPASLDDIVSLADGRVVGVATSGFGAAAGSAPVLLYVSDSRRTSGDVSMARGTVATIELSVNATTGGVSAAVLDAGRAFESGFTHVEAHSGVLVSGYVLVEGV